MNQITDWFDIFEEHFSRRKKAFLIFDKDYVLQYISNYAKEILEFEEDIKGITSFKDLFPPLQKNPEFLLDKNNSFQSIYDLVSFYELKSMMTTARLIVHGSHARKESRGSHFRSDYPETDDENFKGSFFYKNEKSQLKLEFRKANLI